jgi:hypothetical protein
MCRVFGPPDDDCKISKHVEQRCYCFVWSLVSVCSLVKYDHLRIIQMLGLYSSAYLAYSPTLKMGAVYQTAQHIPVLFFFCIIKRNWKFCEELDHK